MSEKEICKLLPLPARLALVAASKVEPGKPRAESVERAKALERVIREIKDNHPLHFKGR